MCRIRSIVFSNDGTELACGSSDGSIKLWNVWTGEQPSLRGHWPGEEVIALAYSNSNNNNNNLMNHQKHHHQQQHHHHQQQQRHQQHNGNGNWLASSSTDHTIRIWKKPPFQPSPRFQPQQQSSQQQQQHNFNMDTNMDIITIQIRDAGHAYALLFSPDNTYLVSGHHPQQPQLPIRPRRNTNNGQQQQQQYYSRHSPPETIYLWSVATGMNLRRIENGGMPIGFLTTITTIPNNNHNNNNNDDHYHQHDHHHHQHQDRLLSTCAGESLKLWSLSRQNNSTNNNQNNSTNNNHNNNQTIISSKCLQRLFLDGYTTVMPIPIPSSHHHHHHQNNSNNSNNNINNTTSSTVADIMVASIDGSDSFTVWNTGGGDPSHSLHSQQQRHDDDHHHTTTVDNHHHQQHHHHDRQCKYKCHPMIYHTFPNTSPYEIKFTTNCTKVASVDNFTQVKVWNVQTGKLLKTFVQQQQQQQDNYNHHNSSNGKVSSSSTNINTTTTTTTTPSLSTTVVGGRRCHGSGGFPIHEIAFCQDSTVAVVSRFYNEIHLFST
ncbi:WD repeat-containing protein [Nitzschia inconspicua]|uniref:WD repeat-containing protein n=1 Tax=Nitzschia inconspicua TaxID=303405 RepID=A0A9K3P756_9STRA|nr:WD repeat-containing protein [Nitzschia inconspicua]